MVNDSIGGVRLNCLITARASVVISASAVMSPQQDEATGIVYIVVLYLTSCACNKTRWQCCKSRQLLVSAECWLLAFWRAGELQGDESATCLQLPAHTMAYILSCLRLLTECCASVQVLHRPKKTSRPSDVHCHSVTEMRSRLNEDIVKATKLLRWGKRAGLLSC